MASNKHASSKQQQQGAPANSNNSGVLNESAALGGDWNLLGFNRVDWSNIVNGLQGYAEFCAQRGDYAGMARFNRYSGTIAQQCLGVPIQATTAATSERAGAMAAAAGGSS